MEPDIRLPYELITDHEFRPDQQWYQRPHRICDVCFDHAYKHVSAMGPTMIGMIYGVKERSSTGS